MYKTKKDTLARKKASKLSKLSYLELFLGFEMFYVPWIWEFMQMRIEKHFAQKNGTREIALSEGLSG